MDAQKLLEKPHDNNLWPQWMIGVCMRVWYLIIVIPYSDTITSGQHHEALRDINTLWSTVQEMVQKNRGLFFSRITLRNMLILMSTLNTWMCP